MKEKLFNDGEYIEILAKLNGLMRQVENISQVEHKVLIYNVLQYFDYMHREPITRMMHRIQMDPQLERDLVNDKTVQKLCELYDVNIEASLPKNADSAESEDEAFITATDIPKKKDWLELGNFDDFENKKVYPKNYEKVNFLILRIGKEIFAVKNQCYGSVLPIDMGKLEDHFIICPWHGCKYDLKTGQAVNQVGKQLEIYPVAIVANGLVKIKITY